MRDGGQPCGTEPTTGRGVDHRGLQCLPGFGGGAAGQQDCGVAADPSFIRSGRLASAFGEVHGLEVCRVVDGPDGTARLEVGVGAHDREAFGLVHGDVPMIDALANVVAAVAAHREPGAEPHPLNRIGAERLRATLIADPARVGATSLHPAEPPVPPQ